MALRYQEVKLEIKKLILSSKEGSRIPSRNFLSRKYQVARNTIDKAITELEQEGYLKIAYKTRTTTKGRPESVYIRTDGPGNPEENQGPRREYQKEQR